FFPARSRRYRRARAVVGPGEPDLGFHWTISLPASLIPLPTSFPASPISFPAFLAFGPTSSPTFFVALPTSFPASLNVLPMSFAPCFGPGEAGADAGGALGSPIAGTLRSKRATHARPRLFTFAPAGN